MYLYLTKSLLPLFLLFSYVVIPAMADEDDEVVSGSRVQQETSLPPSPNGLCAVDKDYFANRPDLESLSQAAVLTAGTQIDVTKTVLRLVPKDQRCSKEIILAGRNSCMVCRQDVTVERQMVTISKPQTALSPVKGSIVVCTNGPGTCASWMARLNLTDGLMLSCFIDSKSVRDPMSGPMATSPFLELGISIKVPCANLKPAIPREGRRPW